MFAHNANAMNRTAWPRRLRGAGVILILLLSVPPLQAVRAQEQPPAGRDGTAQPPVARTAAPVLAGHRFTPTFVVRPPFISTHFRNILAVGSAPGSEIPLAVIDGEEISYETGDVLFSTLMIEYQQAVRDWMAFLMNVTLAGRLGTETASLISQGVTVTSGFRAGWLLKITQSDDMALSGLVQVVKAGYTAVDLARFVEGIVEDGLTEDDQLVYDSSLMMARTGLSYAWAINPTMGLTAAADIGYGESPDRSTGNKWLFDAGAAVDFDLRRAIPLPLGAAVGFRSTTVPESAQDLGNGATTASVRVDYIGRSDLNIGLEIASQWQDVRESDRSLRFTIAAMEFRYYF